MRRGHKLHQSDCLRNDLQWHLLLIDDLQYALVKLYSASYTIAYLVKISKETILRVSFPVTELESQLGLCAEQLQQGLTLERENPWLKMETGTEVVTLGSAFGELGSSGLLRNTAYRLTAGAAQNSSSCMFHSGTLHIVILCNLKQVQYNIPESQ